MSAEVDFCVNCYERTYRTVLAPGFFPASVAGHGRRFARRTALINNVDDRSDAERRAQALVRSGELDTWFFVADHLDAALQRTGLTRRDLGRAPHFLDWGLVLVTIDGPAWMVHCDPEIRMREPVDWMTPSIELMENDDRVMVANPQWYAPTPRHDTLGRSTLESSGDFALGLGFSDQIFLARRSELGQPIYRQRCIASLRYPMANVVLSFEARVDAWMRHHARLRANFLPAVYAHPDEIGGTYPNRRLHEKAAYAVNHALVAAVAHAPLKRRCWRGL